MLYELHALKSNNTVLLSNIDLDQSFTVVEFRYHIYQEKLTTLSRGLHLSNSLVALWNVYTSLKIIMP